MEPIVTLLAVLAVLASVGMFIAWWGAERRASAADDVRAGAIRAANRYWSLLQAERRQVANLRTEIAKYQITETEHFAAVPREGDHHATG